MRVAPPSFADQNGYSEIVLVSQQGPGADEASSASALDRYTAECPNLRVAYSTGTQGDFSHQPPFTIEQAAIVDAWEGEPWPRPDDETFTAGDIQPYPGRDEFIVVRNLKIAPDLSQVRCVD